MAPNYIAVDGPPGAGVTALSRALAERLQADLVSDPAPSNSFLDEYADRPAAAAFQAQIWCLLSRYQQQTSLWQPDLFGARSLVSDYTFAKDRMFAQWALNDDEYLLYQQVYSLLQKQIKQPDLLVLLHADIGVLRSRLRKLVDSTHRVIKLDVLENVAAAWQDFAFSYTEGSLLVINTSRCRAVESDETLEELVSTVLHANPGKHYYQYGE